MFIDVLDLKVSTFFFKKFVQRINMRNAQKMGRKGNWFSNMKKALSLEPKEEKDQKSKKKWFGKQKLQSSASDSYLETDTAPPLPPLPAPPQHQLEEIKVTHVENADSHVHVAEGETAVEAELLAPPAVPAVQTTAVRVQAAMTSRFAGKSGQEEAAIKIQTAFRGYLARRALRALRGLVRLKSLMEGPAVKRQAVSTLRSMQTLARVQSQIRSRRIRMLEENQALQKQLLQKHAKELQSLQIEEEWDDSLQSKEQIEAKLLSKYEAAMRRERALAYAFTHQQTWKNSSRSINLMFIDPTNPTWGWSWLERWTPARPTEKELNDQSSVKSANRSIAGGEISKSYARYQLNSEVHSPTASQNPGTPSLKSLSTPSKPASAAVARKLKKASPKDSWAMEDDSQSVVSMQSRRHSIAGSVVRDDESLGSSPAVPSYMVPTQSAKARSRMQGPLAVESETPEKGSSGTAKKRLSYPPSPARPRRHSGPPKVESNLNAEITVGNGVTG